MIHARQLARSFTSGKTTVEAVAGIDLDVAPGELVAFLGPNGAGKSTTLRMLTTLLPPSSGSALVAGADVVKEPAAVRSRIGYIGQKDGAGHSYRVWDELIMQGRFYGLSRDESDQRGKALFETLDLTGMELRKVSTLSGGQKRRLDIALGLIHSPSLLFLDEPSTGMDPQNRANLWEHIMRVREQHGTTIVLTTHYLDEADQMAERVIIIDHGQIIADDTAEALKADQAGDRITIRVEQSQGSELMAFAQSHSTDAQHRAVRGFSEVNFRVNGAAERLPEVIRELDRRQITALAASSQQPTLDDVFLNLTGRSLREGAEA